MAKAFRSARLEVHEARDGSMYWLLRAPNGRVTCNGETHPTVGGATRAADAVQYAFGGVVVTSWSRDAPPSLRGASRRTLRSWRDIV